MLYIFSGLVAVIVDQLVKLYVKQTLPVGGHADFIPGVLGLTNLQNRGAAFSMLQGKTLPLIIVTFIALGIIVYLIVSGFVKHPFGVWSLVALCAGAVGNLVDRIFFGYVQDMFETLFVNFAVFNVADCYVTLGTIAAVIYFIFIHNWKDGPEKPKKDEQ